MHLHGFMDETRNDDVTQENANRRQVLKIIIGSSVPFCVAPRTVWASGADTTVDSLDVQDFLRKGVSVNPMGVSGQAGKSRPETGVFVRSVSSCLLCICQLCVLLLTDSDSKLLILTVALANDLQGRKRSFQR